MFKTNHIFFICIFLVFLSTLPQVCADKSYLAKQLERLNKTETAVAESEPETENKTAKTVKSAVQEKTEKSEKTEKTAKTEKTEKSTGSSAGKYTAQRIKLVEYSKKFLGKPYVSGGIGPDSFDCSGFVFTMSRESIGVQLPRMTRAIYKFTKPLEDDSKREPGDLVFFKTTGTDNISHVGIYLGNDEFIHAASDGPQTGVIISTLKSGYWKKNYAGTGRYLGTDSKN